MSDQHFVYVYRDLAGNPIYFGQGFGAARPADHLGGSHNPEFADWLRRNVGRYRLQVMGPLGSKQMADAVETALISACKPASDLKLMNVQPGVGKFMFRSYGVPEDLSSRIAELLGREELREVVCQFGPIMFVMVHQREHPLRFDPARLPGDSVIRERIRGWWQVGKYRQQWIDGEAQSPGLLVGVTGVGGSQIVIAAAQIDATGWRDSQPEKGNLYQVPLLSSGDLDAAGLRGRPISSEIQLKFYRARYGHFRIFGLGGFMHEAAAGPHDV